MTEPLIVAVAAFALIAAATVVGPRLGVAWGVALGAVISPTDAVATSIVKRTPVSKRVVAILDGESLLNDATAGSSTRTSSPTPSRAWTRPRSPSTCAAGPRAEPHRAELLSG